LEDYKIFFMKIALISAHSFSQPGGVRRHILGMFNELKRRKIEAKIIAPRRKLRERYPKHIILLGTSFPISFSGAISDLTFIFTPFVIEKVLLKEKFDILHFHNFSWPGSWQILNSPLVKKTLNILTFHANLEGSRFLKNFPWILEELETFSKKRIDGIIGISQLNLKYFKSYSGPKVVIPNGIDLDFFNPKIPPIKKYLDGKINILFVGRIEERKGLIFLLRAYKILTSSFPFLRLIIVGEGPLKKECEEWVKKNELKNVVFERLVEERRLPTYYNSCHIFCSPAIFGESFGMVLVEAMACQKPVVAFNIEGYREVLAGKGEKFLAEPKDFKDLAKKIEILIKNPNLREEMGKWGREKAKNYAWPKIVDKILNFYEVCKKEKSKK